MSERRHGPEAAGFLQYDGPHSTPSMDTGSFLMSTRVEAMPAEGTLKCKAYRTNASVILEVSDTGEGIPAGLDDFQLFKTTKPHGSVVGQFQTSLNKVWGVVPKSGQGVWGFVRQRFVSFAMVLAIGFPSLGVSCCYRVRIASVAIYRKPDRRSCLYRPSARHSNFVCFCHSAFRNDLQVLRKTYVSGVVPAES